MRKRKKEENKEVKMKQDKKEAPKEGNFKIIFDCDHVRWVRTGKFYLMLKLYELSLNSLTVNAVGEISEKEDQKCFHTASLTLRFYSNTSNSL